MLFVDLYIWKSARILVNDIYKMMHNCKDYSFKDQLQRASISIMNNIAEGCNSGSNSKYINFLKIARGSCAEVDSMLYLCEDFKYCTYDERFNIQKEINKISKGCLTLIKILKNKETK